MGTTAMGKVVVAAKVENLSDLFEVHQGRRQPDEVRAVELPEALVDTGATYLSLPRRYVRQLGLIRFERRRARTSSGRMVTFDLYGTVQLTVQGRTCRVDVSQVSDKCPVWIGQVPLEQLDFVVDAKNRLLIGNPEHGGEQMFDRF